jgi:hypothetical protein
MEDKKYIIMVTIPQREQELKKTIDSLYNQVDELRIVFNDYLKIPDWVKNYNNIRPLLNTPDKYTSNAIWLLMNDINGYVFTVDDDIIYPSNYVEVMIKRFNDYSRKVILSLYGETVIWPAVKYKTGRTGIGFQDERLEDTKVDIAGVGCTMFHTDVIKPIMKDFPDQYSRDPWFAILAAKNNVSIVRIKSCHKWLKRQYTKGPRIAQTWRRSSELTKQRQAAFINILVPLLQKNQGRIN